VNSAVTTGSVICVEPDSYQGSMKQPIYSDLANYIKEVERIRKVLADDIFLGKYYDDQFAKIQEYNKTSDNNATADGKKKSNPGDMPGMNNTAGTNLKPSAALHYKVQGNLKTDKQTIVIANDADDARQYVWEFTNRKVEQATLYVPFEEPKTIKQGEILTIKGSGLHILVEK
jgi:hypothetical protein